MNVHPNRIHMLQMCMLLFMALGMMNQVMILSPLLGAAKRDAWVGVLGGLLPGLLLVALVHYIMKATARENLYIWIRSRYGRALATALAVPAAAYMWLIMLQVLKDATDWTKSAYLPMTPVFVVSLIFMTLAFIAARSGLQALAVTAGILLPVSLALSLFLAIGTIPHADYLYLLPLLEDGVKPVIRASVLAASGFAELAIILLMQHRIQPKSPVWPLFWTQLALCVLMLLPTVQAIGVFGPKEASKQMYTFYEEWRMIRLDKFIEHIDVFSVLQNFSMIFIRISLMLFLLGELLAAHCRKWRTAILLAICALTAALIQIPVADYYFHQVVSSVYMPSALLLVTVLTVTVSVLVRFKSGKEARRNEQ